MTGEFSPFRQFSSKDKVVVIALQGRKSSITFSLKNANKKVLDDERFTAHLFSYSVLLFSFSFSWAGSDCQIVRAEQK